MQIFGDFPAAFLLLISALIPLWSESRRCVTFVLLNMLRSDLWPERGLSRSVLQVGWRPCVFFCRWRRQAVLGRHVQVPDGAAEVSDVLPDLLLVLPAPGSGGSETPASPLTLPSSCIPVRFCLTEFGTVLLGAYLFRIVLCFWGIDAFIIMECPSLSPITFLFCGLTCLKSV